MLAGSIPTKFSVPWGNGAFPANIRVVPTASQLGITPGAASFTDGFPPLNFTAVAAGGIPPFGQDMNGVLNVMTAWDRWVQAGGPIRYDSSFSTSIGGYPKGGMVQSDLGHALYASTADNNTTNPNSGGANWIVVAVSWTQGAWTAAGSANVQTITIIPAPPTLASLVGVQITVKSVGTNTGAVTLNPNGLGAVPIVDNHGNSLNAGALQGSRYFKVAYDGASFEMLSNSLGANSRGIAAYGTNNTFTVPAWVTQIHVRVWGGGGSGGGANNGAAAGGGGGGYAEGWFSVTPGQSFAVTVGAGGTQGGGIPTSGGTGGTTSFGALLSATGGLGGAGASGGTSTNPVSGGVGTGGDLQINGGGSGGGLYFATTPLVIIAGAGGTAFYSSVSPTTNSGATSSFPGGGSGGGGAPGPVNSGVATGGLVMVDW